HLMTHAFFKALLFMGAGSVIAAMGGEQSLDKMGGFRRAMPFTFATFTIGALALSAFPPLAGLFSKDAILAFDLHRGGLYALLAAGTDWLERFLQPVFRDAHVAEQVPPVGAEWAGIAVGGMLAVVGVGTAWFVYVRDRGYTLMLRDRYHRLHDFLAAKWYFDELYDALFVRPTETFGRFGRTVVENAFVQGVVIGGAAAAVRSGSAIARGLQSGYLRAYALFLILGL